ncbi:uncharacterized protein BDZ99DRAFT_525786 [Mytilinidion resinicola]|uniref:Uncharacterized protein n=1 Tax=Mytilinidion resinicola TaxID=574789 RepID=A0A6A6Y7N5_9PEZI|nr:uncharacterized protein BDZ99DRAFT_525786 [Mytilinidion resinicola]KAF2804195.1 hypothetical protein BDZ99DRAFT_525786 [Mytilinidion resinicola]
MTVKAEAPEAIDRERIEGRNDYAYARTKKTSERHAKEQKRGNTAENGDVRVPTYDWKENLPVPKAYVQYTPSDSLERFPRARLSSQYRDKRSPTGKEIPGNDDHPPKRSMRDAYLCKERCDVDEGDTWKGRLMPEKRLLKESSPAGISRNEDESNTTT